MVMFGSWLETSAAGFDNMRPGMMFGGDIGFSPATMQHNSSQNIFISGTCVSGFAGWGLKPELSIALHGDMLFYDASTSTLSYQGFFGLAGHYFFKPDELSPFIVVGAGMYVFHKAATYYREAGPGFLFSVGQEMNRHVRISLSIAGGKTDEITHLQVSGNVGLIFY